jgi:energy-coupling factor transporter ATP-binding protein EcfA2
MLKSGANVLLLDEPTNDLDTETLAALEDALEDFAGCAVIISHDRMFLDRLATHILAFEGDSSPSTSWFEGEWFEATSRNTRPTRSADADTAVRLLDGADPLRIEVIGLFDDRGSRAGSAAMGELVEAAGAGLVDLIVVAIPSRSRTGCCRRSSNCGPCRSTSASRARPRSSSSAPAPTAISATCRC